MSEVSEQLDKELEEYINSPKYQEMKSKLSPELQRFMEGDKWKRGLRNLRKYCSVDFQKEKSDQEKFAEVFGDFAAACTVLVCAISKDNKAIAVHHLYWGWIIEKFGKLIHSDLIRDIGYQIKWDDVLNHTLPLAMGIGKDENSPLHLLNGVIFAELDKIGIHYPKGI